MRTRSAPVCFWALSGNVGDSMMFLKLNGAGGEETSEWNRLGKVLVAVSKWYKDRPRDFVFSGMRKTIPGRRKSTKRPGSPCFVRTAKATGLATKMLRVATWE